MLKLLVLSYCRQRDSTEGITLPVLIKNDYREIMNVNMLNGY